MRLWYTKRVLDHVDWSHRGEYMHTRHGLSVSDVTEALNDPSRVIMAPDYNSASGQTVRVIGFS